MLKRLRIQIISLLFACCLLTGCSKDSHEQITVDYLTVMGRFVEICESIDSTERAQAEKGKIDQLLAELKGLKARSAEIGIADERTRNSIEERYEEQFDSLTKDYSAAISSLEKNAEIASELESELKTLAQLVNARPPRIAKK